MKGFINEFNEQIADLNNQLMEKDETIKELEKRLDEKEKQINAIEKDLEEKDLENKVGMAELYDMIHSKAGDTKWSELLSLSYDFY